MRKRDRRKILRALGVSSLKGVKKAQRMRILVGDSVPAKLLDAAATKATPKRMARFHQSKLARSGPASECRSVQLTPEEIAAILKRENGE